jgi:ribosomal protein L36
MELVRRRMRMWVICMKRAKAVSVAGVDAV